MLKRLHNWTVHNTNPLHILCRLITGLMWYDKVWSWVFCRKHTTKEQLVHQAFLERKRKSIDKKFNELNGDGGK